MSGCHAFVDESGKGASYNVCAAVVCAHDADGARKLARSFLIKGQSRWHFVNESTSRKKQILRGIVDSDLVRGLAYYGKGNDAVVREAALRAMAEDLLARGATRVLIESRQGRDHQDKRVLFNALAGRPAPFEYHHVRPAVEAGVWLADAIAWSLTAGGVFRQQIEPMIDVERDLGRFAR